MKTNKSNNKKIKGKTFIGQVVSDKAKNTLVILIKSTRRHPIYKKIIKTNKKIYAQNNLSAKTGDFVKVVGCRPLSKLKKFTTLEIIKN